MIPKGTKIGPFCILFVFLSCSVNTGPRFGEHDAIIRAEWAVAQEKLSGRGVERAYLVIPDVCTFIPHEGKIATSASPTACQVPQHAFLRV